MDRLKRLTPILTAFILVACGGAAASPSPGSIGAELKEYSITLAAAQAAAGNVTFQVRNTGSIEHEFVVVRTDLPAAGLPIEAGVVAEDGLDVIGEQEGVAVGESADLAVALPAGHYVVFCNIEGHYAAGMRADFTTQ